MSLIIVLLAPAQSISFVFIVINHLFFFFVDVRGDVYETSSKTGKDIGKKVVKLLYHEIVPFTVNISK